MAVNKQDLFKSRLEHSDVEVPGVGTVRVRALSRAEAMKFEGVQTEVAVLERKMLSLALVEPALTEEEVGKWQEASSAGELTVVLMEVLRLSGMDDQALKESVKRFRE